MTWIVLPTGIFAALVIYVAGAITARVMYERGRLHQGSRTFRTLEFVYTPLQRVTDSSPGLEGWWESCVGMFVPKGKEEK
jgi:hypothetical protein